MGLGFGIPIFLVPHKWARVFGWPDVPETNESRYFGRCLGGLALAATASGIAAAMDPQRNRSHFVLMAGIGWTMVAVHIRGALERAQPLTETAEIPG